MYCFFEIAGNGDFYIFISAASDLKTGENIFEKKYVDGYHYYYSVLFALFLKPFAGLPYEGVKFVWLMLNALLFFDLLRLLYYSDLLQQMERKKKDAFILLLFLASLRFFTDNIHTAQITILILWCCIRGLYFIFHNRVLVGAFVLAIGINIKLLPIVLVPYLLYRGYFKAAICTALFYFIFMFTPSLIIGHAYNMQLLHTWAALINPANQIHVLDVDERSFHGLSTLLSTLFVEHVPDVYALPIKRNIADVSLETLSKLILGARLLLVMFTLYFLKLPFFVKAKNSFLSCVEISYILLLVPLIFPHQQHYAFLFAIPAFGVLLYALFRAGQKKWLRILLILVALAFNLKLLLGAFNPYYDHFKIITYFALLLIPMLASVSRRDLLFSRQ